jgi:glycyl-tRNA synthetase beta chain
MGSFDEEFLAIPGEVIRATIRNNQKCFVVSDPKTGKLDQQVHPHRQHRGQRRRQGHRRRQRARDPRAAERCEVLLRDRSEDEARRPAAEIRAHRVSREARHAGERIKRIERLAARSRRWSAPMSRRPKRAAHLAKADLLTEVVGEFPELQGLMGKYYALAQGEDASVAAASEEHYKPQGPAIACRPIR